jgi:citrate synthase
MLREIGSVANVPAFIKRVKAGKGRLMGFGHRVYKNYDPRARIIKRVADQVFAVTKPNPLLSVALELERIALADDYFVTRKPYPECRFLFRARLPGHGPTRRHVSRAIRHPAYGRLVGPVAGDGGRPGAQDRASPAALPRCHAT